jgi:hypothetical protein
VIRSSHVNLTLYEAKYLLANGSCLAGSCSAITIVGDIDSTALESRPACWFHIA